MLHLEVQLKGWTCTCLHVQEFEHSNFFTNCLPGPSGFDTLVASFCVAPFPDVPLVIFWSSPLLAALCAARLFSTSWVQTATSYSWLYPGPSGLCLSMTRGRSRHTWLTWWVPISCMGLVVGLMVGCSYLPQNALKPLDVLQCCPKHAQVHAESLHSCVWCLVRNSTPSLIFPQFSWSLPHSLGLCQILSLLVQFINPYILL